MFLETGKCVFSASSDASYVALVGVNVLNIYILGFSSSKVE